MIVLEIAFLTFFWSWVVVAAVFLRSTKLPAIPLRAQPSDVNLPAETVRFEAADGALLEAWVIRCQDPEAPWILCVHGLLSNRSDLLSVAPALHRAGFHLLLLDLRGHGGSPGRTTSFGCTEQKDVEAALAWMGRQPDLPARPYGFFGVSMGGVAGLQLAADDERLGIVAVDSPYASLREAIAQHLKTRYAWVPRQMALPLVEWTYRLRFGRWPGRLAPIESIRRLQPRPFLLIHGEQDTRVPSDRARALFANAGEPKEFWLVKGVGHMGAYGEDARAYCERLVEFFRKHHRVRGGARPAGRIGGVHDRRKKANSAR